MIPVFLKTSKKVVLTLKMDAKFPQNRSAITIFESKANVELLF
jgi:hypothetical protein